MSAGYKVAQPTSATRDPTQALEQAIENLNNFARHNASSTIPNFYALDLHNDTIVTTHESPAKKTVDLIHSFLTSPFSDEKRQQQDKKRALVQEKLLRSLDVIKDHYVVLKKLQHGSPSQQRFAETALSVIEKYNSIIHEAEGSNPSLSKWLARFVYEAAGWLPTYDLSCYKIEVPYVSATHMHAAPAKQMVSLAHALSHAKPPAVSPTTQEADAFRMKAITLINNHALPIQSVRDAMRYVREAPITVNIKGTTPFENTHTSSVVSFSQTLTPFPGEVIKLEGSFSRQAESRVQSIPIPGSFRLLTTSTQTGFPHPSQHNGWALADKILPQCPHRLNMLPLLQPIFLKKWKTARALLPEGPLNTIAKQILERKQRAFDDEAESFLQWHHKLLEAIGRDSSMAVPPALLNNYFAAAETAASPFAHLSLTHQTIADLFINRPFDKLQEEWLERVNSSLYNSDSKTRAAAATTIMREEENAALRELDELIAHAPNDKERATLLLIRHLGPRIGGATRTLILQQMAEKLELPVPKLTPFDKKIQAAAILQLTTFLEELEDTTVKDPTEHMETLLRQEISLFNNDFSSHKQSKDMQIVAELEQYATARAQQIQEERTNS